MFAVEQGEPHRCVLVVMANETSVFPIFIDSRPGYLAGCSWASLLQLPLSSGTVLTYIAERLRDSIPHSPRVVRSFEPGPAYDEALRATGAVSKPSVSSSQFWGCLDDYEPSDWLLFIDPRCFPTDGPDLESLLRGLDETPRLARHIIAMAPTAAGTSERVEFDAAQRVRSVQRYYAALTWNVARGVACSMIPVASLQMVPDLPFGSLLELRNALAGTGLPSRDIPVSGGVVDLELEQSLLTLNERGVGTQSHPGAGTGTAHPTARLIGNVILHEGSEVAEGATVIGPTVIGAHARVGRNAVIAQCVVAPGLNIADGVVARHCVVTSSRPVQPAQPAAVDVEVEDGQINLHTETPVHYVYPWLKRAVELVISVTALVVLSPLLALVALLIKLDSRGPVFYGDPREARGGRLFHCYKFRTMRVGAHAAQRELAAAAANQVDGPQFKMKVDPRVTRMGKWLRLTSLDELPQLFNVALGHMSLVGPRPSPFRENQTCVPWRDARLSVRPGITGLWQVCRHQRESGDFHQWIYYDIEYIKNQSFLVDVKILLATLWTGGGRTHVPLSWIISSGRNEYV